MGSSSTKLVSLWIEDSNFTSWSGNTVCPRVQRVLRKLRFGNFYRANGAMDSYLYLEPQFLLREELREPHNYFAILQAIAQGRTRLNEIAQATGLGRQPVSRYLAVLQELQVIERR